jgi:glycosyltransferase involved in cell wall biosynthesis
MKKKIRVLLMNNYSMEKAYLEWQNGITPSHHLWGKIEIEKRGNVEMEILPFEKYKFLNKIGDFLRIECLDQQVRALRKIKEIDIIYAANGAATSKLLVLLKWLKLIRIPIVAMGHQPQFFAPDTNKLKRFIAKICILQFDVMVFLSREMRKDTINYYKISSKKATDKLLHLDWGPDPEFYSKFDSPVPVSETNYAICAGTTLRDMDTLIEAFRGVNFHLKIFTTPRSIPTVENIPDNVTISTSGITYRDLLPEYNQARIILVPTIISENPNNTHGLTSLMDALALGKPIIITRNKNIDLDIEKEGIGFWANRNDPEHWRLLLNNVLFDEEALTSMGAKAKAKFKYGNFNAEKFVEGLEKVFLDIYLKKRKR